MVPDVLQDVHLVHGLDLLLLLLLLSHGLGRAHSGGNSWLSGERWLSCHWRLRLRLGLGFGFSPQVQNLIQVFFDSRKPQGDALSITCRRRSPSHQPAPREELQGRLPFLCNPTGQQEQGLAPGTLQGAAFQVASL